MKVHSAELSGLKIIELDVWRDSRGFFTERFQIDRFKQEGLPYQFIQDNHSRSLPGVLRGLHFQMNPHDGTGQGKMIGVVRGKIWDVVVDVRSGSPTFGKFFSIELSADNGQILWVPAGFAHGFCVLGNEPADIFYKVDSPYQPKEEGGILWSDTQLNIPWPLANPILSERDQQLPSFQHWKAQWRPQN